MSVVPAACPEFTIVLDRLLKAVVDHDRAREDVSDVNGKLQVKALIVTELCEESRLLREAARETEAALTRERDGRQDAERALAAANAILVRKDLHLERLIAAVARREAARGRRQLAAARSDIAVILRQVEQARSAAKVAAMFPEAMDIKI